MLTLPCCMQAQQALLRVQWPPGLEQVQEPDSYSHLEAVAARKGSSEWMDGQWTPGEAFSTSLLEIFV
jgi:hypothetical protein